jgi:F-type H+-transporting ATPase subunit epsilon
MLRLNIVTPERPFLDDSCESVTLPGKLGQMQILSGHAALLSELISGVVTIEKSNKEVVRFMVGEGFAEVNRDEITLLCEQARYKSEIDKAEEERLLKELTEQIKQKEKADAEQRRIFAELERCVAKLSLFE